MYPARMQYKLFFRNILLYIYRVTKLSFRTENKDFSNHCKL